MRIRKARLRQFEQHTLANGTTYLINRADMRRADREGTESSFARVKAYAVREEFGHSLEVERLSPENQRQLIDLVLYH